MNLNTRSARSTLLLRANQPQGGEERGGFTLIELLVAVAIVGILAAVAYPSYTEHLRRAARSDAHAALLDLSSQLEGYYADNRTYTGAAEALAPGASENGAYTMSIAETAETYVVSAVPASSQANDVCGTMTLNSLGIRGAGGDAAACWGG